MARLFIKSFMCPHCHTKCSFYGEGVKDTVVLWCTGCDKGVYFYMPKYSFRKEYEKTIPIEPNTIEDYYPREIITVSPSIPKEIADDYTEAIKCNNVSAPKATVAMCRRALQNACVQKGANSRADLIEQIDELESNRLITPAIKDIAHTIRKIGNWGAHPQTDSLKDVTIDDAQEIVDFTSEFLDELFVRPSRLEALKTKKGIK